MNKQQKAARTRAAAAATRVWEDVKRVIAREGCKCGLKKGMDYDDLRKLKGGCTDTPARGVAYHGEGRWICPALNTYRTAVGRPPVEEVAA